MRVLIIDLCFEKDSLHYEEFVRPVIDIIKSENIDIRVIHRKEINSEVLFWSEKVILCGTALKDDFYLENIEDFSWIESYEKPILGICAGGQLIAKIFGSKINLGTEIGMFKIEKVKDDLLIENVDISEVYLLHNNYFENPKGFEVLCKNIYPQLIKKKSIYCCLFHPEVRNKKLITNFVLNIN